MHHETHGHKKCMGVIFLTKMIILGKLFILSFGIEGLMWFIYIGTKSVRNTTKLAQDCRICKHTTRHITIWVDKKVLDFWSVMLLMLLILLILLNLACMSRACCFSGLAEVAPARGTWPRAKSQRRKRFQASLVTVEIRRWWRNVLNFLFDQDVYFSLFSYFTFVFVDY